MSNRRIDLMVPLAAIVMVAACAGEPEPATVSDWLGPEAGVEMRGEVEGERVDVVAAADQVACKREYSVLDPNDATTWADGLYDEIEVAFNVEIDGVERLYEVEFFNHDFSDVTAGTTLKVVPVILEDAPIGADEVHVEVQGEWEIGDDLLGFEELAIGGTVEIRELTGTVGPDGLVTPAGDGSFGAFIDLQLNNGEITASLTAPCTVVEVETFD